MKASETLRETGLNLRDKLEVAGGAVSNDSLATSTALFAVGANVCALLEQILEKLQKQNEPTKTLTNLPDDLHKQFEDFLKDQEEKES